MSTTRTLAAAAAALLMSLTACGTTPPTPDEAAASGPRDLSYSNKWRIEVSEGANSDGEIVFNVTPMGAATQVIRIVIDDGTSEDHVARVIKRGFEAQLDTGKFDIEIDDGEDVLVKKDLTEPRFALQLISSTVKGVRLQVQKE